MNRILICLYSIPCSLFTIFCDCNRRSEWFRKTRMQILLTLTVMYVIFVAIFLFANFVKPSKRYTYLPNYHGCKEINITMISQVIFCEAHAQAISQVIRPGYTAQQAHIFVDWIATSFSWPRSIRVIDRTGFLYFWEKRNTIRNRSIWLSE